MENRMAKQCRNRFNNLKPDRKDGQWTEGEDERIIQLQEEYGNKWSIFQDKPSSCSISEIIGGLPVSRKGFPNLSLSRERGDKVNMDQIRLTKAEDSPKMTKTVQK